MKTTKVSKHQYSLNEQKRITNGHLPEDQQSQNHLSIAYSKSLLNSGYYVKFTL